MNFLLCFNESLCEGAFACDDFSYFCEMFLSLLIKGFIIGCAVSIPLGPIGVLIIQRTVNKNPVSGFFSGVGAATSDTIYAIIAGFSLTYIINFIKQNQLAFQLFGAIILLLLGIHIFMKNPVKDIRRLQKEGQYSLAGYGFYFFSYVSQSSGYFCCHYFCNLTDYRS